MKLIAKIARYLLAVVTLFAVSLFATSSLLEPEPVPSEARPGEPVVQVYGADVWGFRGHFAIHTWIATRAADESQFTIHQVIGWRLRRYGTALTTSLGNPDKPWFDSKQILLYELTGTEAAKMIPDIRQAVADYPYAETYTMWPGPNSNSFTQWVALKVPQLAMMLPAKAIGKDWMTDNFEEAKAAAGQ